MGLTTEQANLAMVIASKISGALSIIGSSFIVRDVYKRWRIKAGRANNNEKLATTTFLVLSMSVADLGSSFFAYFLGSWMAPREGGFPGAAGNGATCTAQAFMFGMFFSAGGLSNGTLSLTYWLTICRNKPERELRTRKWTAILFGLPWLWGLVYASASRNIVDPSEIPMAVYCWGSFAAPGTMGFIIAGIVATLSLCTMTILVCVSMVALVRSVYRTERRMDQFNSQRQPGEESNRTKSVEVTKQAILYVAAWLVVMIPMSIDTVAITFLSNGDYSEVPLPNWYHVFFSCLMPLQGLFNSLVYFRPKYTTICKRDNTTRMKTVLRVLDIEAISNIPSNISRSVRSSIKIGSLKRSNRSSDIATDTPGNTALPELVDVENNVSREIDSFRENESKANTEQMNAKQNDLVLSGCAQFDGGQNGEETEGKRVRRVSIMHQFAGT